MHQLKRACIRTEDKIDTAELLLDGSEQLVSAAAAEGQQEAAASRALSGQQPIRLKTRFRSPGCSINCVTVLTGTVRPRRLSPCYPADTDITDFRSCCCKHREGRKGALGSVQPVRNIGSGQDEAHTGARQ